MTGSIINGASGGRLVGFGGREPVTEGMGKDVDSGFPAHGAAGLPWKRYLRAFGVIGLLGLASLTSTALAAFATAVAHYGGTAVGSIGPPRWWTSGCSCLRSCCSPLRPREVALADDNGIVRGVEVQARHVSELGFQLRVGGELKALVPPGLQIPFVPEIPGLS
jgi:hypothetical protein